MELQSIKTEKKTLRFLVADDSEFARKNIARVVAMIGGEVVAEAMNGVEAVALYFKNKPDIMLLDITMPVMSGIEVLKKIMEKDSEAKIVMVSSVGHKEMLKTALSIGAAHFITKPFKPEYAKLVITDILNKKGGDKNCDTNI